jgi:hypothetical protein
LCTKPIQALSSWNFTRVSDFVMMSASWSSMLM